MIMNINPSLQKLIKSNGIKIQEKVIFLYFRIKMDKFIVERYINLK